MTETEKQFRAVGWEKKSGEGTGFLWWTHPEFDEIVQAEEFDASHIRAWLMGYEAGKKVVAYERAEQAREAMLESGRGPYPGVQMGKAKEHFQEVLKRKEGDG